MSEFLKFESSNKETLLISLFLCCFFAPLWGVGYVLPFLLPLSFFLVKDNLQTKHVKTKLKCTLRPEIFMFMAFVFLVLISSIVNVESKWGSSEGFWVVLASFLFFLIGIVLGAVSNVERLLFCLKICFSVGFSLFMLNVINLKTFSGGVFANINTTTTVVLIVTGALSGIFSADLGRLQSIFEGLLLLLFVVAAFYFSIKISSSDAAIPLLVGLFFFMSALAPSDRMFLVMWAFSLLIICAGIFVLVTGDPLDFKSLLNVTKLESFLSFRPQSWFASLSMISQHPWLGIGSGQYGGFYEALLPLLPGRKLVLAHTHCIYLVHFVAHGTITGLVFITVLILNLRLTLKSLKIPEFAPFGLMMCGIWYFYLTYGLVELTPAFRELVPLVWGSSGLLAGVLTKGNE